MSPIFFFFSNPTPITLHFCEEVSIHSKIQHIFNANTKQKRTMYFNYRLFSDRDQPNDTARLTEVRKRKQFKKLVGAKYILGLDFECVFPMFRLYCPRAKSLTTRYLRMHLLQNPINTPPPPFIVIDLPVHTVWANFVRTEHATSSGVGSLVFTGGRLLERGVQIRKTTIR